MKVSIEKIFKSFLENYVKIHFDIKHYRGGLITTNSSNNKRYTISKHSKCITYWFKDDGVEKFEEFKIMKDKGNLIIKKKDKVVMSFSCPTEPLLIN